MRQSNIDEIKKDIEAALKALGAGEFAQQARQLLAVLEYESERDTGQAFNSAEGFITFAKEHNPNTTAAELTKEEKKFCKAAKSLTVISQFTNENTNDKRDNFDIGFVKSFLFVAVELSGNHHSRSDYASFTRQINKYLSMPTVVLFVGKHKKYLTIAFVKRRQNKQAPERDVLGKVSLIHEINLADPHRAHVEILWELSFPNLKKQKTFDKLLEAWIEILGAKTLNKKFYDDILDWFNRIVDDETKTVKFPPPNTPPDQDNPPTDEEIRKRRKRNRQVHTIRLITRLMFVWFMKEKGLVSSDLFSPSDLESLLKDFKEDFSATNNTSYYRAILQNLFFATLNTEILNRKFSMQNNSNHRIFSCFHYKEEMQQPKELDALFKKTPFVNGGLFDCLDSNEATGQGGYRVDCFSDNPKHSRDLLSIPDRLFFDDAENTKGIITIFKKYKFTLQESTPIEQEVALDPELLGKVFERLLATKDIKGKGNTRKRTGSYYTPQRVVDYMVGESLLECLAEKVQPTDGDKDAWRDNLCHLLNEREAYEDTKSAFDNAEKESIVRTIADIKIIDPAVGSGEFPMNILHRLTLILRRLDANNRLWKKIQVEKATQRAQRSFASESDKNKRAEELDEINAIFEKYKNSDFGRKLYLIQNCIYGVDIQPEAIQIAKLRFFISLAIEQGASGDSQDNYGFKPLPNLETRFVAADTVIGKEKQQSFTDSEVGAIRKKLELNRERYFHANTRRVKLELKKENQQLRIQLEKAMSGKFNYKPDLIKKIAAWDPFDANNAADWFDSDYMFGVKGFDLVIGNPPYVQLQASKGELRKKYQPCQYETFIATGDIYCLFYELGIKLLNPDGHLVYISPNKYMRADYGQKLRTFLRRQTTIKTIIDFGELPVFEAGTDPSILLTQNKQTAASTEFTAAVIKEDEDIDDLQATMREESFVIETADLFNENWVLAPKEILSLIRKMQSNGQSLYSYVDGKMYRGIVTGRDKAFVIDASKQQELIDKDPCSEKLIKPWIRGRDMQQWYTEYSNLYIIFTDWDTNINDYPEIKQHLESYKSSLLARASPVKKFWYAHQAPVACHSEFYKPKIIWSDIAKSLYASIDDEGFYVCAPAYACFANDNEYLLGILNSQLLDFYYRYNFYAMGDPWNRGRMRFKLFKMKNVPVADADKQQREEIAVRVKRVLSNPKGAQAESLKTEIDALVYQLYGLNKEEIALVEHWQSIRLENERKVKK